MLWLLLIPAVFLVVALAISEENRKARRFGALLCPRCQQPFGKDAYSTWGEHTRTSWRSKWDWGPLMRCPRCIKAFRYTKAGELHAEQFPEHSRLPENK